MIWRSNEWLKKRRSEEAKKPRREQVLGGETKGRQSEKEVCWGGWNMGEENA
jgi:hypothetical protein